MPAYASASAAPHNALPLWTDGLYLFTELPGPNGPTVIRYPLTTAGLSSALGLIRTRSFDTLDRTSPWQPPQVRAQSAARANLRKLGLIP